MSETTDATDAQRQLTEYDRQLAETGKLHAEERKRIAGAMHRKRAVPLWASAAAGAAAGSAATILVLPDGLERGGQV